MADEEVVIGVRTEGTDTSATNFDALKEKLKAIGTEGAEGFKKIADSEVSVEVKTKAAIDTFGDFKTKAVEAIKASAIPLEDQKDAIEAVEEGLKEAAEEARQFGRTTEDAVDPLAAQFARIRGTFEDFDEAVASGSPRMNSHLNRLIIQQKNLEDAIKDTYGSLSKATPEAVADYEKIQVEIDQAKGKVRTLTDELAEQRTELKEGGEAWTGLGDAINKAAGPMGTVVAKMALVSASFTEGYSMGRRFAEAIGTDMSEMDRLTTTIFSRLNIVIRAFADNFVGLGNVISALLSGEWEELKRAGSELADNMKASSEIVTAAVTKNVEDWRQYSGQVKESTGATAAADAATKALSEATTANAAELAKQTESQKTATAALADATRQEAAATAGTGAAIEAKKSWIQMGDRRIEIENKVAEAAPKAAAGITAVGEAAAQGATKTAAWVAETTQAHVVMQDLDKVDFSNINSSLSQTLTLLRGVAAAAKEAAEAVRLVSRAGMDDDDGGGDSGPVNSGGFSLPT